MSYSSPLRPVSVVMQLCCSLVCLVAFFHTATIPMSYSEASMLTAELVLGITIVAASILMQAADSIAWRRLLEDRFYLRLIGRPSILGASIALSVHLFKSRNKHFSTFGLPLPDVILHGQIMLDVCFTFQYTSNGLTPSLVLFDASIDERFWKELFQGEADGVCVVHRHGRRRDPVCGISVCKLSKQRRKTAYRVQRFRTSRTYLTVHSPWLTFLRHGVRSIVLFGDTSQIACSSRKGIGSVDRDLLSNQHCVIHDPRRR